MLPLCVENCCWLNSVSTSMQDFASKSVGFGKWKDWAGPCGCRKFISISFCWTVVCMTQSSHQWPLYLVVCPVSILTVKLWWLEGLHHHQQWKSLVAWMYDEDICSREWNGNKLGASTRACSISPFHIFSWSTKMYSCVEVLTEVQQQTVAGHLLKNL